MSLQRVFELFAEDLVNIYHITAVELHNSGCMIGQHNDLIKSIARINRDEFRSCICGSGTKLWMHKWAVRAGILSYAFNLAFDFFWPNGTR